MSDEIKWTMHRDGEVFVKHYAVSDYLEIEEHGPSDYTASAHVGSVIRRIRCDGWSLDDAKARAELMRDETRARVGTVST